MTTDRDGNPLAVGDHVRIVRGAFSGGSGVILSIVADQLQIQLHWNGYDKPTFIDSAYVLKDGTP